MFVTHLECSRCGATFESEQLINLCRCGAPLLVRYDLEQVKARLARDDLASRAPDLWRYRELLPVKESENIVSLGEGMTPLLRLNRLGAELGLSNLYMKDEGLLPTGSFKARGAAVGVSRAKELGVKAVAMPTNGNAGGAWSAYCARARIESVVVMPTSAPAIHRTECAVTGAKLYLVDGLISDAGGIVGRAVTQRRYYDVSTLKEPYRIEGKKTMGLELAEQFDWSLPDVILYPTGGGTGLIGMWKAFAELGEIGWLGDEGRPRMISCQSDGCAPISTAWAKGERFAEPFPDAATAASGLRVPAAVGDFMILDAVNESGGQARDCPEASLLDWARRASALEGIAFAPETGACLGVLEQLVAENAIDPSERVVIFNTGAAQKYVEVIGTQPLPTLAEPVDWTAMGG